MDAEELRETIGRPAPCLRALIDDPYVLVAHCALPAGHPGDHATILTWSDESAEDPEEYIRDHTPEPRPDVEISPGYAIALAAKYGAL